jgi:hypothetical protein
MMDWTLVFAGTAVTSIEASSQEGVFELTKIGGEKIPAVPPLTRLVPETLRALLPIVTPVVPVTFKVGAVVPPVTHQAGVDDPVTSYSKLGLPMRLSVP